MFFDKLQALCDEKGIAMSALLDQVGMSRGNMARWKDGLTPKPATQIKLAEALGVDRSRLMDDVESKQVGQASASAELHDVSSMQDELIAFYGEVKDFLTEDDKDDLLVAMRAKAERNKRKGTGV